MHTQSFEESLRVFLKVIKESEKDMIDELESTGLTVRQFTYIEAVNTLKNPVLSELADYLDLSRPSITSIVNKLINMEIAGKKRADDKRSFYVYLTEKGEKIICIRKRIHKNIAAYFKNALGEEELNTLCLLLNKVSENLK